MAEQLVHEDTGEVLSVAEYVALQRAQERVIHRLDQAIAQLKVNLKAAKDGRDAAIQDLRATAREMKLVTGARAPRGGTR